MAPTSRPSFLAGLTHAAERMSRWAVWFGGALTIGSVLLISFDVVVRKFFGFSTGGADELSSYAFAISTSWALAFATLQRANVRVDVLYQYLPVRLSAVLDWLSIVALGVFMVMLTFYAYDVVATSWVQNSAANTPLATPLYIPQGLWFMGLIWMCLVLILMLLRASIAFVTGNIDELKALAGVRSTREEAEEEAAAGERMVKGQTI
jgi:TRAP-type C4-dicarboxylate transport system permease small subunit